MLCSFTCFVFIVSFFVVISLFMLICFDCCIFINLFSFPLMCLFMYCCSCLFYFLLCSVISFYLFRVVHLCFSCKFELQDHFATSNPPFPPNLLSASAGCMDILRSFAHAADLYLNRYCLITCINYHTN